MSVTRRPESPEDEPFLRRLIMETAALELGASAWPEQMRDHLLGIQYQARRQSIRANFPDGASQIVLLDGAPAGWIVTADLPDQLRIVEIMILPEQRGKGVGSAVIREVMAAADRAGKPVRLGVNATNAGAIRLYERLGFRRVGGDQVQYEMERPVV